MWKAKNPFSSRGAAGMNSRYADRTSAPWSAAQNVGPPKIVPTSCRRNRNEVTTPKLPPPPRIAQNRSGCSVGARAHPLAAGEHELGLEQAVDREAVLAGQVPEPAAERQPADAGGGDDSARRREAVLAGGAVDLAPRAATADADRPRLRIDLDLIEQRQI